MRVHFQSIGLCVAIALTACGKEEPKEVYSSDDGSVEITQDDKGEVAKMTIKTDEGTAQFNVGTAADADVGVALYPGAEPTSGGSWSMETEEDGAAKSAAMVMHHSEDSIDEVAAFYKDELSEREPETMEMSMPTGRMIHMTIEDNGESVTVMLMENKEKAGTDIQITRSQE